ncbi:hypothetical protein METBIDRAFT_10718 [Metschnikowia bicuspidata var. bicuspidata NRRL YB-4993]|uniref:N-acetyltransferase domain-containing protein n=1 Tax=Metschnikowia bicuspidata var. bicuspidata NRRL YB-4993 TaxID=869754 RepID=A0A1A0HCF1_9ASCO|nr:hypothetical protein METBIDRAFT_10718 [Metschnikowia bicuspidata var. bicuspidata NRRL YB-4993]OBA21789.1 hypothetical protein METBIDRAFT_10718 [Metschnikowia bicuspidata var. bicuspidata NRRL YB-4993]
MTKSKENPHDFVLEQVHDKKTRDYTRERNAAAWKNLLSVQAYVTREHVLGLSKITCSDPNRLVVFALRAKRPNADILCSCELLIRQSWRYEKDACGNVQRKDVLSGCIGGVYTYEEHRGRGLATIMIDKLVETAKTDAYLGPSGFTFLYSEVGEFYVRNGFKSFHVDLLNLPLSYTGLKHVLQPGYELVKYNEFGDLFERYNQHFDRDMRRQVQEDGLVRISVNPTADYVDWFHIRAKYLGLTLFGDNAPGIDFHKESLDTLASKFKATEPMYFGIKSVCPQTGRLRGFLVWQYEYGFNENENRFENYVTLVKSFVGDDASDPDKVALALIEQLKAYLEAEHSTPQMSNFHKIVMWESEISPAVKTSLINKFNCTHGLENSSRSAILYNNEADDEKLKLGSMIWENNTKLPWF